jgi:hypothetical protein
MQTRLLTLALACGLPGAPRLAQSSRALSVSAPGDLSIAVSSADPLIQGQVSLFTLTATNNTPNALVHPTLSADFPRSTGRQAPPPLRADLARSSAKHSISVTVAPKQRAIARR